MARGSNRWPMLMLLLILGGIIGAWLGDVLVYLIPKLAFLGHYKMIGLQPFTFDLQVFTLTFGFSLRISFFTIVGLLLALWLYRRM